MDMNTLIEWFILESPLANNPYLHIGEAYNGYVALPKGHPWYGVGYDDIDAEAPGGLTYSEYGIMGERKDKWIIGFDTGHHYDNNYTRSKLVVEENCKMLYAQAVEIALNPPKKKIRKRKVINKKKKENEF